jgi:hypothetical protein
VTLSLDTSSDGAKSGSAALVLASHDSDLSDASVPVGPVALSGTIDNFAIAAFEQLSGGGSFSHNGTAYTRDIGTIAASGTLGTIGIGVLNAAIGLSDLLSGSFDITGSTAFANTGFVSFSGLGAGVQDTAPSVILSQAAVGTFSETITLHSAGSNSSGFNGALADETLTVTGSVACFRQGTRVLTARGELAVEELEIGDRVPVLLGGRLARVVWIGHLRIDCRRHPRQQDVWPVRVQAGAFGGGTPHRDLFLSPDHAVHADGVLIPIRYLVNGTTVAQVETSDVIYWHIELDQHEILLAEGLPCESYLDTGNRGVFENGGAMVQVHPDFALRIWETEACAALVVAGAQLAAAKTRLLARAFALGYAATGERDLQLMADGRVVQPSRDGGTYRFALPPGARAGRLISRRFVPAQIFPDIVDHRQFGVAISALRLDGCATAVGDPRLTDGWHAPEPGLRWTDGDAGVTLAGVRALAFDVALTGS